MIVHNCPATSAVVFSAVVFDEESPVIGQLRLVYLFCAWDLADPSPHRGQRRAMESNRPT